MSAGTFLSSPEGRLALLLHRSGVPSWILLRLAIELIRRSTRIGGADFLSVAEMIAAVPNNEKSLPDFKKILDLMRQQGDANVLADILLHLEKACEDIASTPSPVRDTVEQCLPHMRMVISALKHEAITAPSPLILPISNNAYTIEFAGLSGVVERANEHELSMKEATAEKRAVYENILRESKKNADKDAANKSEKFIKSINMETDNYISINTKSVVSNKTIKSVNSLRAKRWEEAKRQFAMEASIALPDGNVMNLKPGTQDLPADTLIEMTTKEKFVSAIRRSGGIGGGVAIGGGLLAIAATGGSAAPLVLAGMSLSGGAAWTSSNKLGRKSDRLKWEKRFSDAMNKQQAVLKQHFLASWDETHQSTLKDIDKFFDIERRKNVLSKIGEVANNLSGDISGQA